MLRRARAAAAACAFVATGTWPCVSRRGVSTAMPTEGAMHTPGESGLSAGSSAVITGKETWSQFGRKLRFHRRRIRVLDVAAKMSYEYQWLKSMCRRRPVMRQWAVRDDFCDMSPGVVVMSPSMQAAFMKVFRLKDKGVIRRCLRDIVPVIEYRNRAERPPSLRTSAAELLPAGEADTLNQKKRELFERTERGENMQPLYLHDRRSQAKLRFKIRQRLLRFQRQLAVANAVASRTVLYSSDDAIGYFLFRGPAMYAGVHRVLFEVSKLLPHFVPRTLLDFGAGTGTATLAAKEVYDPDGLAYPLYRSLRQTMTHNVSAAQHQLHELRYDLRRLERNNSERKKARFMAVAALLERGEVRAEELPAALRDEVARVAAHAAAAKRQRLLREAHARHRDVVDGTEWSDDVDDAVAATRAATAAEAHVGGSAAAAGGDDDATPLPGEEEPSDDEDVNNRNNNGGTTADKRTWWERFVDLEVDTAQTRARRRLRPLQAVTAIEPSPGMMEVGTMVLHEDVPNVTWKRYLLPEDETTAHDLVIAAYTLSELATTSNRKQAVQQLWKMTRGVLVLVEFANLHNFNLLMEARDAILEHADVGLWDWQPALLAPCPHAQRCPLRHCKEGVKRKRMRICHTEVPYRATFVESWARHLPLRVGIEPISYLVFARNELVPERAARRDEAVRAAAAQQARARDATQRALYEASLAVKDVVFERLSDEALHRPATGVPPRMPHLTTTTTDDSAATTTTTTALMTTTTASDTNNSNNNSSSSSESRLSLPTDKPRIVTTSAQRYHKLIYPTHHPLATHRYNRGYVDVSYQRQRAVTPAEMLVVREELLQMRQRVALAAAPRYLRIVRDPQCRGRMQATFCTPDATLISARVYRRYYGDASASPQQRPKYGTLRWQHIGGWKLLRHVRSGSLFPHDVPLYAVRTFAQVDQPNTLLDTRHASTVEQTAMQYNDAHTLPSSSSTSAAADGDDESDAVNDPTSSLTRDERRDARRRAMYAEFQQKIDEQLQQLFGRKVTTDSDRDAARIDARREITPQQWADAVRKARQQTVRHVRQALPHAAQLRAMRRRMTLRWRNLRREQTLNRRR